MLNGSSTRLSDIKTEAFGPKEAVSLDFEFHWQTASTHPKKLNKREHENSVEMIPPRSVSESKKI